MIEIRTEEPNDRDYIFKINLAAFENDIEARLVDILRTSCNEYISLVALDDGIIVGHLLFTPVTIDGSDLTGMGLAPMAVLPSHQGKGIGTLLVRHGLKYLQESGCPFVIVLGHPEYYPRFGFELASKYRFKSQWEGIPDEAFMVKVFNHNVLPKGGGIVRYRDEFDDAI